MICAVDFETYYDNEVSITTLGVYHYLRHPQADLYLVSIATDTGLQYVGSPFDFDWNQISGSDWTWLSHNAQFDQPVFERIQEIAEEKGNTNVPQHLSLAAWHDTADLAAFLGVPRSLKESSNLLLGTELSKDVRDQMKGQRWAEMTPEFREEVCKYAIDDAVYCLQLFTDHGHKWPQHEREISAMTRNMALRGVPLDVEGIKEDIRKLTTSLWEYKQSIPWKETNALLSPIALREECAKHGLKAPDSFAQNDPEAEKFFEAHAETYPWLMAVREYRKASKHLSTLETMLKRERGDGWMTYGLKYGGAHTLRDSGDSGLNLQNLPKGIVSGVDVRAKIKAPEGYTFAIVDLSQIEPRVLHWLAGDKKMLKFIKEIPDLYEAQARAWGLYDKEGSLKATDPALRHQIKQLALGLGYGMGAVKFSSVAGVEPNEAMKLTTLYRDKNKLITALWRKLQQGFDKSLEDKDRDFELELASGRFLKYRQISGGEGGASAHIPRMGKMMKLSFWGGVFCENLVQATARDVFMHQCLQIEKAGIPVIMRIHDEAVCLVPKESAQERLNQIISIMSTAPDWALTPTPLPLAAEGSLSEVYKK
jgi:DNA polymerase I-like protein with 3'-5' exonuclease and polymerase domains